MAYTPYVVEEIASLWDVNAEIARERRARRSISLNNAAPGPVPRRRLKVGVVSSDYGVHPVSSLIRGVLEFIDQDEVELFCFALTNKMSWWGHNITGVCEHFIKLIGINQEEAAVVVAETAVEILIDLNGHTLNSGLPMMRHRPAPIQISFLGLPTTSGGWFIDYYMGDPVALPAEIKDHFTEKLLLLPPCYIASDYSQLLGGVLQLTKEKRWARKELRADRDFDRVSLLFGTFSNTQKFDPAIVEVWMNILSSYADSKMFFVEHVSSIVAKPHIRNMSAARGVDPDRIAFAKHHPWIHHIQSKTAIDLVLDTTCKNGHTTGLDAVFAGVPMVTMAGGATMPARAGESIHAALESDTGLAYSLKEYEDIALEFARDYRKLRIWRDKVERLRTTSTLFDTKRWTAAFTRLLQGTWEVAHVAEQVGPFMDVGRAVKYNVFHLPPFGPPKELDVNHVVEPTIEELDYLMKRQTRLEAAGGAGRRADNAKNRFIPANTEIVAPRGGVGKGGPGDASQNADPNLQSSAYGQPTPAEFYDRVAHRVYGCSWAEKFGDRSSCSAHREDGDRFESSSQPKKKSEVKVCSGDTCVGADGSSESTDKKTSDQSADEAAELEREYNKPVPREVFKRRPLVLNVGGISSEQNWVSVNAQPSSKVIQYGQVDVIRKMHDLKV